MHTRKCEEGLVDEEKKGSFRDWQREVKAEVEEKEDPMNVVQCT